MQERAEACSSWSRALREAVAERDEDDDLFEAEVRRYSAHDLRKVVERAAQYECEESRHTRIAKAEIARRGYATQAPEVDDEPVALLGVSYADEAAGGR